MNENSKISIGNAIKVVMTVATIIVGWAALNRGVDQRLTALETTVSNAELARIPATLARIESKVDRLEDDAK